MAPLDSSVIFPSSLIISSFSYLADRQWLVLNNHASHHTVVPRKFARHPYGIYSSSGNVFLFLDISQRTILHHRLAWKLEILLSIKKHDWRVTISLCLLGAEMIWPWSADKVVPKLNPQETCIWWHTCGYTPLYILSICSLMGGTGS